MSIIEMETKLFLFIKQRANLFQARKATGNETDPDWIRKEIKPISDEIDPAGARDMDSAAAGGTPRRR